MPRAARGPRQGPGASFAAGPGYAARMRRVALLPGLALACALACTLTGNGVPGVETRALPVFDAVEVFDGFAVTLAVDATMAAAESIAVEVSGDANALGRLFAAVHAVDTLSVGVDPNHLTELERVPGASARVPALRRVYAEDGSVVEVSGARGALEIELREAATATVQGDGALAVEAVAAGDAVLELGGQGPSLNLVVSGRATVDASAFAAEAVRVEHDGTGEVVVCATTTIVIRGTGAALVRLRCG
jgi:hypothetical protein